MRFSLFFLFIAVGFFLMQMVIAVEPVKEEFTELEKTIENSFILVEGKNEVEFDDVMLVSELVDRNPEITAVSYYDSVLETSVGYVNTFGGIGTNFVIKPGISYEIFASQDIKLVI